MCNDFWVLLLLSLSAVTAFAVPLLIHRLRTHPDSS